MSSAIPPIVQGDATIPTPRLRCRSLFYWVILFSLMGLAALATRLLPGRMVPGDDTVRETSFVAYSEAAIDELYYLATEHANREVGPGKEAYDVRVGGMGIPLTGDDTRKSWPSTYKVRDRRRWNPTRPASDAGHRGFHASQELAQPAGDDLGRTVRRAVDQHGHTGLSRADARRVAQPRPIGCWYQLETPQCGRGSGITHRPGEDAGGSNSTMRERVVQSPIAGLELFPRNSAPRPGPSNPSAQATLCSPC